MTPHLFHKQTNSCSLHFYVINLIILETRKKPLFLISGGEGEGEEREIIKPYTKKKIQKRNPTTIN